jgi:uncharacterized membrane protein
MPAAIMAAGAILLGFTLQLSDGFYDERALFLLLLAILCCAIVTLRLVPARWLTWGGHDDPITQTLVTRLLLAGIASNLILLAVNRPGMYLAEPHPYQHPTLLAGLAIVAILVACGAGGVQAFRLPRLWFPLTLATFTLLGVWMIAASPDPHVDVITVYQFAAKALRHGKDPYTMTFPNIYSSNDLYPPGTVVGGRVLLGFPYPPLSLLLGLPGLLLGDVRYADVATLIGAAALIGFSRPGLVAPLAATLLLSTPRSLFVIEQAWTEPLTLVCFAATMYAALHTQRRRWPLPIMLGLLVASKQYMIVALPLAWLLTRPEQRWRDWAWLVVIAIVTATIVTLPFVIWNVDGFVRSVIQLQLQERFRLDSLSLLSWFHYKHVFTLTPDRILAASAIALLGSLLLALWRASRTPAGFAAAIALTLLCVFVSSKKAFCNYYFCALGVMCAAIAAGESWPDVMWPPRCDTDRG